MDEATIKIIAQQLRQPHGEFALDVAEKMNEGNLLINQYTIEALDAQPNENILEIGMANGIFVKDILSKNSSIKYSGCDYSEDMVREATKHNKSFVENGQAQFFHASADNLPFSDNIFDKIFTANTIYFWDDITAVLSEFSRVLKPKGQIILSVRPRSVMEHIPTVKYGFTIFSKDELIQIFSDNNYKITSTIEKAEPDQEILGVNVKVSTLIVIAEKL